jgi:hypothetical protein
MDVFGSASGLLGVKEETMLEVPGPPTASGPAADHPFAFDID